MYVIMVNTFIHGDKRFVHGGIVCIGYPFPSPPHIYNLHLLVTQQAKLQFKQHLAEKTKMMLANEQNPYKMNMIPKGAT